MSDTRFSFTPDRFREIAGEVIAQASARGATAAETEVSESIGQSVTVRQREVETIEYTRDKGLSLTVYIGQQRGHASSTDLSPQAISDTIDKALTIARFTAADDCAGLADADLLARDFVDLDLYRPWGISVERSIEVAQACEAAAFAVDKRITNSEGASVGTHDAHFIYANSLGFMAGYPTSRHHVSCSVIAGKDEGMQRDDWYTSTRDPDSLEPAERVGAIAGERALHRLGARKIDTTQAPVMFEAPLASGLLGHFVSAASGGNLYRKSSFLVDALRNVVQEGLLEGYFLGSYSGRKLGMRSTGNAGGNHNLILEPGELDFQAMLKRMGRGLLVTELLGMGVNMVSGDYSRGAAGFWVEDGAIAYPVQEVTIASNLKDMFLGIAAIGSDVVVRGSRASGSVLIDRMTIAGD
jgi:PmbA protein